MNEVVRPTENAAVRLEPQVKAAWLTALRSGKYRQIDGRLCRRLDNGYGYCCLGVLAKVVGLSPRYLLDEPSLDEIDRQDLLGSWYSSNLDDLTPSAKTIQQKLSEMNDEGKSFSDIADWVETNL